MKKPRSALVERDRIAAGRRIVRRHRDDALDVAIVDVQPGKGVRNVDLNTKSRKARTRA